MVTPQVGDALTAWMIRAGKRGEREDFAINGGLAGGGFSEVPDLTAFSTIEEVRTIVPRLVPALQQKKDLHHRRAGSGSCGRGCVRAMSWFCRSRRLLRLLWAW